jgi:hypothetical protein
LEGAQVKRIPLLFKTYDITDGKSNATPVDAIWMVKDAEPENKFSSGDVLGFNEDVTFLNVGGQKVPSRGIRSWQIDFTWYDQDTLVTFPPDTIIREMRDAETGVVTYDTTIYPAYEVFHVQSNKWQDNDTLFITTWKPLSPSDVFEFKTTEYKIDDSGKDPLANIRVVPNPYIVSAFWETDPNKLKIQFTNLPKICTIHIFNIAGELINKLEHWSPESEPGTGTEDWNLWTMNRQEVAFGLYIYVVETPNGKKKIGKFAIIR